VFRRPRQASKEQGDHGDVIGTGCGKHASIGSWTTLRRKAHCSVVVSSAESARASRMFHCSISLDRTAPVCAQPQNRLSACRMTCDSLRYLTQHGLTPPWHRQLRASARCNRLYDDLPQQQAHLLGTAWSYCTGTPSGGPISASQGPASQDHLCAGHWDSRVAGLSSAALPERLRRRPATEAAHRVALG